MTIELVLVPSEGVGMGTGTRPLAETWHVDEQSTVPLRSLIGTNTYAQPLDEAVGTTNSSRSYIIKAVWPRQPDAGR